MGKNPEKELQFKELKADFEKKLADMTDSQRVVFLMSRMDGLKNREIAEKLNISIKAVEKRMSGALVIIKEFGKTIYSIMISVLVYSLKIFISYLKLKQWIRIRSIQAIIIWKIKNQN